MPARRIKNPHVGVLLDREVTDGFDESVFADGMYLPSAPDERLDQSLGRFLDSEVDLVVIAGDDAFIGEVITTYRRHFLRHPTALQILVMSSGTQTLVADQLAAPPLTPRSFRRLKSALLEGRLQRRMLCTLKITSSARPAADYGFSFGAGLFYGLFEAYRRARPAGGGSVTATLGRMAREQLLGGGEALAPVRARLAVDRKPQGDSLGYLVASSLQRSWLGLSMGDEQPVSFRMGDSGKELAGKVAKNRALPRLLQSRRQARPFETIHLDWSAGYVLDGQLYEPARPYVVQVAQGPLAHFLTL